MTEKNISGYECINKEYIKETKSNVYVYKHIKTGLKLVYFENDSEEYFFSFCFPTLPNDNKGKPHIVEHCTLAGSELYPYKDPFKELDGKSVSTFMNAMTFIDATIYPASSKIYKDFEQLFEVYADAVFNPLLSRESFEKEGVKRTIEKNGNVKANGIVLSEILSASYDKDTTGDRTMMKTIFNGTPYMYDSGGVPKDIVLLTYKDFLDFYKQHYSYNKCTLVLSGKNDILNILNVLDERYLSKTSNSASAPIERNEFLPEKISELRFYKKPNDVITYYERENETSKPSVVLHYLSDIKKSDRKAFWTLTILEDAIFGSAMSPLSKALTDSKKGGDLSTLSGLGTTGLFYTFSIGLDDFDIQNDVKIGDKSIEDAKTFFENAFINVIENGIDKEFVEASIKYFEFLIREDGGTYPRALGWTKRLLPSIVDGSDDMFVHLRSLKCIDEIKHDFDKDPKYFADFVKKHILSVNKKSLIIAVPSSDVKDKDRVVRDENAKIGYKNDLECTLKTLNNSKVSTPIKNSVSTDDLVKLFEEEHYDEIDVGNNKYIYNNSETQGISYVNILFDVSDLTTYELQVLKLLSTFFSHVGVGDKNAVDFTKQMLKYSGGLSFSIKPYQIKYVDDKTKVAFSVKAKVINEDMGGFLHLLSDMLKNAHYSDEDKLQETLIDIKGTMLSMLSASPSSIFINSSLDAFSKKHKIISLTSGFEYIKFIYGLKENDYNAVIKTFISLSKRVFNINRLNIFITSDTNDNKEHINEFINELSNENAFVPCYSGIKLDDNMLKLYAYPFETAYNSIAVKVPAMNEAFSVYSDYLESSVIWDMIRSDGGAYGCGSIYSTNGEFLVYSLLDPHITTTYKNLEKSLETLPNEQALKEAKIQALSSLASVKKPAEKNEISLNRYLVKLSNEERFDAIKSIVNTTVSDIKNAVNSIEIGKKAKTTLSDKKRLEKCFGDDKNIICFLTN